LLLLCSLLLIRCEKDVSVIALTGNDRPLQGVTVNVKYTEHQLYKNGKFFYEKEHSLMDVTGENGRCEFKKQPYSVFSWILYSLQQANVEGVYGHAKAKGSFIFHWCFSDYPLFFSLKAKIKVVSSRTLHPIPNASVKLWTTDKACDSLSVLTGNDGTCTFDYSDITAKVNKLLYI